MSNKRFEMYEIRRVLAQMRLGPRTGRSPSPGSWGERISPGSGNWPMRKGFLTGGRSLPDDIGLAGVFGAPRSWPAEESSVLPWPDLILAWHRDKISGQAIHSALVRNHGTQGMQSRVGRFWEVPGRRGQGRIGHDHAGLRSRGGGPSRLRAGAAASRPEVGSDGVDPDLLDDALLFSHPVCQDRLRPDGLDMVRTASAGFRVPWGAWSCGSSSTPHVREQESLRLRPGGPAILSGIGGRIGLPNFPLSPERSEKKGLRRESNTSRENSFPADIPGSGRRQPADRGMGGREGRDASSRNDRR